MQKTSISYTTRFRERVIPLFYDRNEDGLAAGMGRNAMRDAMKTLPAAFQR